MTKRILLTLILWGLLGPLYLLFVPIYLLLYCYRVFVSKVLLLINREQQLVSLVSGIDFSFSTDNYWKNPKGCIAFVYKVKGFLSPESVKERLESRLNLSNGNYDRLKSLYPIHWSGYPFWARSKYQFNLETHVKIIELENRDESANNMNGPILTWLSSNFRRCSPLWDVLIIPNNSESIFGFRIHHIIGDGISMQHFLEGLLENEKLIKKETKTKNSEKVNWNSPWKYYWLPLIINNFIKEYFFHQDYFTRPKIKRGLNLSYTTIMLTDLKLVRSHLSVKLGNGESVNFTTVLLFILSTALRKFLLEDIKLDLNSLPNHINIVLPLPNLEASHPVDKLCNFWTHGIFKVPISDSNKVVRLAKLHRESQIMEQTKSNQILSTFTQMYDVFPKLLFARLTKMKMGTPVGLTNLLGGKETEFLCSCEIVEKYAILGLQWNEASIAIGSLSYKDKLTITILSNETTVPSETLNQKILQYIEEEVKDLIREFDLGQMV